MVFNYSLKRSKRRTIGITVKDGCVFVSAPKSASISSIETFLNLKAEWVNRKLHISLENTSKYLNVLDYKEFLFFGNSFLPTFCNTKIFNFKNSEFLIPKKYDASCLKDINVKEFNNQMCAKNNSKLLNAIKKFYKIQAIEHLTNMILSISKQCNLSYNSIALTNAKTKWGSCDSNNKILLNWRLIFLPVCLIRYVIVHELCHTQEHNHSASFWLLVERYENNFKKYKKELKDKSLLITLFRE